MGNTVTTPRATHAPNSLVGTPSSVREWRPSSDNTIGALIFPDGPAYYGSLHHITSTRSGFGIYLTCDGVLYEGVFVDDRMHGECVRTSSDGKSSLSTFRNGELISQGEPFATYQPINRIVSTRPLDTPTPPFESATTPTSVNQWLIDLHMEKYQDRFRGIDHLPSDRIRDKILGDAIPYGHRARLISNLGRLTASYQSTGGAHAVRVSTPPAFHSGASSSVYVPRAPSRADQWLIPSDQLRIDSRLSTQDTCEQCSQVFRGTWLGKDVVIRQYFNVDLDARVMELLSRMAKIRHPNICLFMAASYSSGTLSIVTEFVHHGSVDKFLSSKRVSRRSSSLSTQNVLHLSRGIAVGCGYLRKQGFSHKNLKPSNVLIDSSLEVKLTDYFVMEFNDLLHRPGCTRNPTVKYVAPESLRLIPFIPFGIDSASDVYSFGIILWELITGRKPYDNLTTSQIRVLVGFAGFREPRARLSTLRGLSRLIEKCTYPNPSRRLNFEQLVLALSTMHKSANSAAEDALITFISGR